jgi:two-component system, sensor histidine kinase and response regulator
MPEMDGFEASVVIRSHMPHIPIVALTAHAVEGGRERCIAAGMDDYLAKPFSITQLKAVIEKWSKNNSPIIQ